MQKDTFEPHLVEIDREKVENSWHQKN